jgi:hypothetical protein
VSVGYCGTTLCPTYRLTGGELWVERKMLFVPQVAAALPTPKQRMAHLPIVRPGFEQTQALLQIKVARKNKKRGVRIPREQRLYWSQTITKL